VARVSDNEFPFSEQQNGVFILEKVKMTIFVIFPTSIVMCRPLVLMVCVYVFVGKDRKKVIRTLPIFLG
jgi:hypothetical protein